MDKRVDFDSLIGLTLGQCLVKKVLKETKKSWEVMGHNPRLERDEALNIFKPGQDREREEQFLEKGRRAAKRGRRKNLPVVYYAEIDENTGLAYQAYQPIANPKGDFEDEVDGGEKFSLEEILHRITGAMNGVANIHLDGDIHGDIKLANMKKNVRDGETYILDEGGRLSSQHEYPGDIPALANCFLKLFNNCNVQIPKKLGQILKTASESRYETITDFQSAFDRYNKGITRRKFLKLGSAIAAGVYATTKFGIPRYIEYTGTHHKLEDIIHEIQITDGFNVSLYEDLLHELYRVKIDPLIKTVPKDQFPFNVDSSGEYQTVPNSYNDQGEWIRAVGLGYLLTGNESYLKEATERNRFLKIRRDENGELAEMDAVGTNLNRVARANMFLIDLIDEFGLGEEYRDVRKELNLELREVMNIFIENRYRESNLGGHFRMSSYLDDPERTVIRSGAIDMLEGMWRLNDKSLKEKLFSHIRLSNKYLFRNDGSVLDAALVHNESRDILECNLFGRLIGNFAPSEDNNNRSCYNGTLIGFLSALEDTYPYLTDEDKQVTRENLKHSLNFYMKNFNSLRERGFFEERFILPVDFFDIQLPEKEDWPEVKTSTYPLVLSLKVLTSAINIIGENEFKSRATDVLMYTAKNLTRGIPISRDIQGTVEGASDTERHLRDGTPNYYMSVDANYLEHLSSFIKK